jgi:hypothetical protein
MPFLVKRTSFLVALIHSLSFHSRFGPEQIWRAETVNRAKETTNIQAVANKWRTLPPLESYYSRDGLIEKVGGSTFDPVVNRTPEQAAAAKLMPTPTSLQADEFIDRPGGPSRLAPAQQTQNKLKGSKVERRLD